MEQPKKLFITFMLLSLVSFSMVSAAIQVSEAKTQPNFLQRLNDEIVKDNEYELQPDNEMVKESEYDSQPDDSVSAQKQPIETNDIADDAITSPKIKDGEVKTSDIGDSAVTKQKLDPNAVKLVVVERSNTFEVPANDAAEGTVNCNSDEVVTGGGFEFNQFGNTVFRDHKSGNGWKFQAFNSGDAQQAFVYADCAHLELGP